MNTNQAMRMKPYYAILVEFNFVDLVHYQTHIFDYEDLVHYQFSKRILFLGDWL